MCPLLEKYGTFIAICNALIEKVSPCSGSGKAGLRFDGDDHTGTANGEMSFNVIWNNSGLVVKGNKQNITGNTVFDAADIGASKAMATFPEFQDVRSVLDYCGPAVSMEVENPGATTATANNRSIFARNLGEEASLHITSRLSSLYRPPLCVSM
eukprot:SAG31_NODE_13523_length_864_cov_0.806536_1_plen_154_part_00